MCRKSALTWEDVSQQFQQSVQHFDTLDCPALVMLRNSDDEQLRCYTQIFDESRSQAPAVINVLLRLLIIGIICSRNIVIFVFAVFTIS